MRSRRTSRLLTIITVGFFFIACERKAAAPLPDPSSELIGPVSRAVYLFNSEACQCERDRNLEAESVLESVLSRKQGVIRPERVDVAKNPAELDRYERLTSFGFMPVLLGLDQNGRVAAKVEGFFKEDQVESLLSSMP
ncbi:MAG: hypothetical protein GX444_10275 [Myxococcales bacterium]|nr:hypothetical protein [Myxococcales bacterium]